MFLLTISFYADTLAAYIEAASQVQVLLSCGLIFKTFNILSKCTHMYQLQNNTTL